MWNRSDINPDVSYRVGLKAAPGTRSYHLVPEGSETDAFDFITPLVDDHGLLKRRSYEEILSRYPVEGEIPLVVDAHGIWLTEEEARQLLTSGQSELQWYKGCAPSFPPK